MNASNTWQNFIYSRILLRNDMGRKHKRNSVKYIKQSNKNLRQENENLKQITNYTMARNIEIQNKVTTLKNYNYGLIKILEIQKEANDFQQQKIEIMESQLSILNKQVANSLTLPFVQQKDNEKECKKN